MWTPGPRKLKNSDDYQEIPVAGPVQEAGI